MTATVQLRLSLLSSSYRPPYLPLYVFDLRPWMCSFLLLREEFFPAILFPFPRWDVFNLCLRSLLGYIYSYLWVLWTHCKKRYSARQFLVCVSFADGVYRVSRAATYGAIWSWVPVYFLLLNFSLHRARSLMSIFAPIVIVRSTPFNS